jgi:hypothetical protein
LEEIVNIKETIWAVVLVLAIGLMSIGCDQEITIQCHSDTTNLKVDGETIGDLGSGESTDVSVPTTGSFLIKWTNYDGEAESETLRGRNVEEGAVWHLYHAYGSFDEW